MRLGKSDLTANGRIDNILTYVFKDSLIVGLINLVITVLILKLSFFGLLR